MTSHEILDALEPSLEAAERQIANGPISTASDEGRAILRALETLDRGGDDAALLALAARLDGRGILRREARVFELRARFRAADYPAALATVSSILELAPDNLEALRTGGRIGNLMRDDDSALRFWERLARTPANDPEAPLQAARIRMRREEHPDALEWARIAAARQPEAVEPLQIAVRAGLERGWPEECDALLGRLIRLDRRQGIRFARQLVATVPCVRTAPALQLLLEAFANDGELADLAGKAAAEWAVCGLEHEVAGRDLDAAAFYLAARRLQPGDPSPRQGLVRLIHPCLAAMREAAEGGDFEAAVDYAMAATAIDPDCVEAWQTVGSARFGRGDLAAACVAFRRVTELSPEDPRGWLTYGLGLSQSGDRIAAIAAIRNARRLATEAEADIGREAEASLAALQPLLLHDADEAATAGDFERALRCCEAAAIAGPDEGGTALRERDILRRLRARIRDLWAEKSPAAAPLCRRYLKTAPDDPFVRKVLARSLMRERAYADALPLWEGLCARYPADSHFHLQVARCCRWLKLAEKGAAAAAAALRLDPGLREAVEIADYFGTLAAPD